MLVSVIIPMYNSSRTIFRCIESVLNQTTTACNFEIIVVNDGSTDNSLELVENFKRDKKISNLKIIDKSNGGAASARNVGLRAATGDWIALLDSDDFWLENKIETQLNILKLNPKIDFLGSNVLGGSVSIWGKKIKSLYKVSFSNLLITMFPYTSTAIFRNSIIDDIGYYDESFRSWEDGDYWFRIALSKEFWFSPEQLVNYGDYKLGYGHSGLSGNLKTMQLNGRRALKKLYLNRHLNLITYWSVKIYWEVKYIRRLLHIGLINLKSR